MFLGRRDRRVGGVGGVGGVAALFRGNADGLE